MAPDRWAFLNVARTDAAVRPVEARLKDWCVVTEPVPEASVRENASRCMDCGVAFCERSCPLGNRIPIWNELVTAGYWTEAADQLAATNNFPEFTGWLCPAPCEASCVLALADQPVAIKQIELAVAERDLADAQLPPAPPACAGSAPLVAIVGSGPAGLAAAQQLTRAGHRVTVFERDTQVGGLLRFGIPDFKMDKSLIDRRVAQMVAEGTEFLVGVDIGRDVDVGELRAGFDAVVLACGARRPREPSITGGDLEGVHQGIDYLVEVNQLRSGVHGEAMIGPADGNVVIVGGGDTAVDCLATANRQGARSVRVLDHNDEPPPGRDPLTNPWPQWPRVHRWGFAQQEGVDEHWQAELRAFVADDAGRVRAVRGCRGRLRDLGGTRGFVPEVGGEFELACELVLVATGFAGVERGPLIDRLDVVVTARGTIDVDDRWQTATPGVFACGDATRGASLVVWAIAEGRSCAAAVDTWLTGTTDLPSPVDPSTRAM